MESGFEKLEIYKLARKLAIEVHGMSLSLPKFEMYEEGSQIRRASKSVGANIVEGYCLRRHKNEYLQYLHRAFGSSQEVIYHLTILFETQSLKDDRTYVQLREQYDHLGRMIYRFIESVLADHQPPAYVKENALPYDE
ncbi:MAG TPA: four helix bundle protein [Bacteroidota bacterium]|jgi:four helix bundle protein|nr:four helix bundle protein [Bacteroidota bacterium]